MPGGFGGPPAGKVGTATEKVSLAKLKKFWQALWPYLRKQKWAFIAIILSVVVATIFQLWGPFLVSQIIDEYILAKRFGELMKMLILLGVIYLNTSIFMWLEDFLLARLVPKITSKIRADAYIKLQSLPIGFYDREPFGNIMSRLTNDLDNLDNAMNTTTTQILSGLLTIVGALIMMFYQNVWLAAATIITVPLTLVITKKIASKASKYFAKQQADLAEINGFAEETLHATILIKAYGTESKIITKFNQLTQDYYKSNFKANFFSGLMMTAVLILNNLNVVILGILGGYLAFAGWLQVGIFASFLQYQRQFTRPLGTLANQFVTLQLAVISGQRVFDLFSYQSETDPVNPVSEISLCRDLQIENVDFAYVKDKPVLKKINVQAKAGEMLALVGPTGSGKTTLSSLLLRFYDPQKGEILFDGTNIATAARAQVRELIGVVLQDVHLFSGTVADNIRFSRLTATDTEVIEAAKKAHAHDFIMHLENGYQTRINGNAVVLSQGQRQLLAIARAFLMNPPVLILDEATSNVDTLTEQAIQQAMSKLLQGRLSLVIAHRLSTVKNADQILVMRDGEIVERGRHKELLAQNGFYAQIYHSQDADLLVE